MSATWLNLTLCTGVAALVAGCFGSHGHGSDPDAGGVRDSGPPPRDGGPEPDAGDSDAGEPDAGEPDAGSCSVEPGFVQGLECIPPSEPGGMARVRVTARPGSCCRTGELLTDVTAPDGDTWRIDVQMRVCECCAACDCIGPVESKSVELGPLAAGTHEVVAGSASCTMEVHGPRMCRPAPSPDTRMPRVLLEGQPLSMTSTSVESSGCGCTPGIERSGPLSWSMRLCDCCEVCLCVDPGYEASAVYEAPGLGEHAVSVPGGDRPLRVAELSETGVTEPVALEIVGPSSDMVQGGPRLWWARVTGEELVCCVEPQLVARQIGRSGNHIELELRSYRPLVDCDCEPPGPTRADAWFSLGELSSGTYTVSAGSLAETFEVP